MKKVKKATKKAPKKTAGKSKAKVPSARQRVVRAAAGQGPNNRTSTATIFVYDTGQGQRVRTSPQLLTCPRGYVEWTVVNLTSGPMPDVDITWPNDGPWGGQPIPVRNGNARLSLNGAKEGKFKYNVTVGGYTEDPEIEFPEN